MKATMTVMMMFMKQTDLVMEYLSFSRSADDCYRNE